MALGSVFEARAARLMEWDELHSVLRHACQSPPSWSGPICGKPTCTSCKLNTDDIMANPFLSRSAVKSALNKGLLQFDRVVREQDLLRNTLIETSQMVLTSAGPAMPSRELAELLHGWGFITIRSQEAHELLRTYRIPLDCLVYRSVPVLIAGTVTLRYQILFDPGTARISWLPTSACALGCVSRLAQPSIARHISALLEVLMGVCCLRYVYSAALTHSQVRLDYLAFDLTKTIMASIRTTPTVPVTDWNRRPLAPGEAGLLYSPRLAPLPGPMAAAEAAVPRRPIIPDGQSEELRQLETRAVS